MLHDLLRRLETLQEEMNGIREELVSTIKESFDLETLKLDEEKIKPLEFGDDSEEEEEETLPDTKAERDMFRKSQSNKEILGKVGSNDEEEQQDEEKIKSLEFGDDSEEEQEESGQENKYLDLLRKAVESPDDPKVKKEIQDYLAAREAEDDVDQQQEGEEDEDPADDSEEASDDEGSEEADDSDESESSSDDEEEGEVDAEVPPDGAVPPEEAEGEGTVREDDDEEDSEEDSEDSEESDDEEEVDEESDEEDDEEEEVAEEDDEKKNQVEENKESESPSVFDKLKIGDKFKLPKVENQTFVKVSPKEYSVDNADPKIQQKSKSVIMNPQSKVISVPKTDEISAKNTPASPASTTGDSKEATNAGTQTSQDTKAATSQKAAKPVEPQLEEDEGKSKERKQMVDLTGKAMKQGVSKADVDPDQLAKGKRIEMEHTKDSKLAEKIALDHLAEIPDYYDRLERMEREASAVSKDGEEKPVEEPKQKKQPQKEPETEPEEAPVEEPSDEPEDKSSDQKEVKEKKQLQESTLDNLVNSMIIGALENIEKTKN